MYKIIGADQKQYGPISADEVRRWIREGRLNGQTLAYVEGSPEWKALALFPEFVEALGTRTHASPAGADPMVPADLQVWKNQLLTSHPELFIGRCLGRSWKLITSHPGLIFGATTVVWAIESVCQLAPVINLVSWAFHGVLFGGLYLVFLKRLRGQGASVGDVFTGFRLGFAQLLLVGVLTGLLTGLGFAFCIVPGLYLLIAWTFSVPLVIDKGLGFWPAMELSRRVATKVWFELFGLLLVAFLPVLLVGGFVMVKWMVSVISSLFDLMRSTELDPKRLAAFARQLPTPVASWALVKIVLLLNLPFGIGVMMSAYEDLFGPRPARTT